MDSQDYCSKLETIPQFSSTCWFNSILHVMLYSQGLRKVIWNELKPLYEKNKTDKFYRFLLFMLNNYNDIEKLEKIYSSFKNLKLKPEYLLGIFLKKYNKGMYKTFMESDKLNKGHFQIFIMSILYAYDINYFHFHYSKHENEVYLSINESYYNSINRNQDRYLNDYIESTDILIVTSQDSLISERTTSIKINNQKLFMNIAAYGNTIDVNGTIYKLDCCLLGNDNIRHAVALIKCNDNNYFIDSSAAYYEGNYKLLSTKKKQRFTTNVCKPLKFDWTDPYRMGTDFTFIVNHSNECSITYDSTANIEGRKSVYNLFNNHPIFIYVKDVQQKSKFVKELSFSSIKSKELLRDFNILSLSELENYIDTYIYLDDKFLNYTNDMKRNFSYFYKKLLKKNLNPSIDNDTLKKEFLVAIIKKHVLKGNVYKYEVFLDSNIIKEEIIQLKTFNNQELLKKLDIKMDIRDIDDMDFGSLYDVLFTKNKSSYDNYLLSLINDDFASMLIKMIIEKKFYRINYIPVFNKVVRESFKNNRSRSRSTTK